MGSSGAQSLSWMPSASHSSGRRTISPLAAAANARGEVLALPLLTDRTRPVAERAAAFHLSLAQALVDQAQRLRTQTGIRTVGLTGGVFQNRVLAEAAISRLEAAGFAVHLPHRIPVNDAGLSFGQVIEFLHH